MEAEAQPARRFGGVLQWSALYAVYAATRLYALTLLPIFLDEIWHIFWSMSIAQGDRLDKPWQHGRGLSVFLNALLFPWAAHAYLWASRCLTVVFGGLTLWACQRVAQRLFGARVAWFAALLYVFCPFTLFYDRLALTDAFLSAFAALALLWSVRLAQTPRVCDGVVLGLLLTLAVLSKAAGVLVFFVPLAAVTILQPKQPGRLRALLVAYVVGVGFAAYPVWAFLSTNIVVRSAVDKSPEGPLGRILDNAPLSAGWLWTCWTPTLCLLGLLGLLWAIRDRCRAGLLLVLACGLPILAFLAVATLWFPRYLLFTTVPWLVLVAWTVWRLAGALARRLRLSAAGEVTVATGLLVAALVPSWQVDHALWTDPPRARLPALDQGQYINSWPSGYGVRDTLALMREELLRHPSGITVVTHSPARRTTAFSMRVEFMREPRLRREDLDLQRADSIPILEQWAAEQPTFVIVSPVKSGMERPSPKPWSHLGGLYAETFKPDGRLCDQIYRLCSGSACGPEPAGGAR